MSSSRTNRRRRTQEERRNTSTKKLIEATLAIASEESAAAVTFESIAKRAGYSRGLAHNKFGSKKGLMKAVIDYLHEKRFDSPVTLVLDNKSGLDALLTLADHHVRGLSEGLDSRAYFIILGEAIGEMSDIREVYAENHDRSKEMFIELIERGRMDGSIRQDVHSETAALMVGSLMVGISMQSLTDPEMDLDKIAEETHLILTRSLGVVDPNQ